jgi:hypothetical protein
MSEKNSKDGPIGTVKPHRPLTRGEFLKVAGAGLAAAVLASKTTDNISAQETVPNDEKKAYETSFGDLNPDEKDALNTAFDRQFEGDARLVLVAQGVTLLDSIQQHVTARGIEEASRSGGKCGVHNERAVEALTRFAKDEINLVINAVKRVALQTVEINGVIYVMSHLILTEFQDGKPVLLIVNNPENGIGPDSPGGTAYRTNQAKFNNRLEKYTPVEDAARTDVVNTTRKWLGTNIGTCVSEKQKVTEKEPALIPQPAEIKIPESAKMTLIATAVAAIGAWLGKKTLGSSGGGKQTEYGS